MFVNFDHIVPLLSLGMSYAISPLTDSSYLSTNVSGAEIFAQSYLSTFAPSVFLRPSVRLGYEPKANGEAPMSVAITERSARALVELGILYNGLLVPSLSIQTGLLTRFLSLETQQPINKTDTHQLSRTEHLWQNSLSLGVGFPLDDGRFVIEPFYRLVRIQLDQRHRQQWGVDISYAFPFFTKSP